MRFRNLFTVLSTNYVNYWKMRCTLRPLSKNGRYFAWTKNRNDVFLRFLSILSTKKITVIDLITCKLNDISILVRSLIFSSKYFNFINLKQPILSKFRKISKNLTLKMLERFAFPDYTSCWFLILTYWLKFHSKIEKKKNLWENPLNESGDLCRSSVEWISWDLGIPDFGKPYFLLKKWSVLMLLQVRSVFQCWWDQKSERTKTLTGSR